MKQQLTDQRFCSNNEVTIISPTELCLFCDVHSVCGVDGVDMFVYNVIKSYGTNNA